MNQRPITESTTAPVFPAKRGGLYRNLKVSVRTVNIVIIAGIAALLLAAWFLISHNGFTVSFDTDGGSAVSSVTALYGETVSIPETPVKEGFHFTGWYTDKACQSRWDVTADTVSDSLTLYAGWAPKAVT